jgi:hypothetical protein
MPTSRLFLVTTLLALATPASAAEPESDSVLSDVEVHAFVSQGFLKSFRNNYLVTKSTRGSFDLTEVGINFTKTVTDRLRMGVQLFSGGFLTTGTFVAKADWFYLDYRWRDWLGLRAGRVKLPFGLYNEINDIDAARLPILLPQSTYPVQNRNFLLAQTGFELYGYLSSQSMGALEYRLYGGTIKFDFTTPAMAPYVVRNFDIAFVAGGRLMWEAPIQGLRMGGSVQGLRIDADLQGTPDPGYTGHVEIPALLWMASLEYTAQNWMFAAEYGRWHTKRDSALMKPGLGPLPWTANERYYAMIGFHLTPRVQLGSYYAGYYMNADVREGRANQQHDVAGTIRFDITPNWLIKLEGHYMNGTAGINNSLNVEPLMNLSSQWGVFLLKTTAYF